MARKVSSCAEEEWIVSAGTMRPKHPHRMFERLQQAALARDADAYPSLGYCYDVGIGTPRNFELARKYYLLSWTTQRDTGGIHNLATMYRDIGNLRRAFYWWNVAIAHSGDTSSCFEMALVLMQHQPRGWRCRAIPLLRRCADAEIWLEVSQYDKEQAGKMLSCLEKNR
jgi:TPR repeat protein